MRVARWGAALAAIVLMAGAGCTDKDDEPDASPSSDDVAPVVNEDHWHAAFGLFVCDLPQSAANLAELGQADSAGPTTTGMPGTTLESEPVGEDGFYPVRAVVAATESACPSGTARAERSGGDECFTLGRGAIGMEVVDSAEPEQQLGQWLVRLALTDEGIDRFNELAALCFQQAEDCPTGRVAIVVGGQVASPPESNNPSYEADQIQISGSFTEQQVRALAAAVAG